MAVAYVQGSPKGGGALARAQVTNTRLSPVCPKANEVQTVRIKMAGAYSIWEFEDAVDCILQSLAKNGVNELRSVNIYCQPFAGDQAIEFDDQECGAPFQMLRYNGRRQRAFSVTSPRLQPEREAIPVAAAIPIFDRSRRGKIEHFIGLLEGQGSEPARDCDVGETEAIGGDIS